MTWQDAFLALAGLVGGGTAVMHGVLIQRLVVRPYAAFLATAPKTPAAISPSAAAISSQPGCRPRVPHRLASAPKR